MRPARLAPLAILLWSLTPDAASAQCVEGRGLILTEVFYDAPTADDSLEWIELRNDSSATIALTGQYSLGWGGPNYLFGQIDLQGSIAPGEIFVVGGPVSSADNAMPLFQQVAAGGLSLQNSGASADGVALFRLPAASVTADSLPIDVVVYGTTNDNGLRGPDGTVITPQVEDAPSGSSIELTDAGWQVQPAPSPNQSPLSRPPSPLLLSEVFYDAPADDQNLEWIELFNRGSQPIVLSGHYSLGVGGADYTFAQYDLQGTVQPGATFVVGGPLSNADNATPDLQQSLPLALQNSGGVADGVALFNQPAAAVNTLSVPVDSVVYGDSNDSLLINANGVAGAPDVGDAPSGSSIERDPTGWSIQAAPSPNTTLLAALGCRLFINGFE